MQIINFTLALFVVLLGNELSADLQCADSEVEVDCPATCASDNCPTHDKQDTACPRPDPCPPPACKCRFNYRRAENGTCIPTESCPPFDCSQNPNEEFYACPPLCPTDDCSDATPSGRCPLLGHILIVRECNPACRCIKNYWRKNGVCVPYEQCNSTNY